MTTEWGLVIGMNVTLKRLSSQYMSGKKIWVSTISACMHTQMHIYMYVSCTICTSNDTAGVVSELTRHPFNVLSLNGSLSFLTEWYNGFYTPWITDTPWCYYNQLKGKRERLGHSEKESRRQWEGGRLWGQECPYLVINAYVSSHIFFCARLCFFLCFVFLSLVYQSFIIIIIIFSASLF